MSNQRRFERAPLYTSVQLDSELLSGTGHTTDISAGGLRLRLELTGAETPAAVIDTPVKITLRVPTHASPLTISAFLAWVGGTTRDPRGRRALDLGLRFADGQDRVVAAIGQFVAAFRYRVLALDVIDLELIRGAVGERYVVATQRESGAGPVGAIVIGERNGPSPAVARVRSILDNPSVEADPPIIYLCEEPGEAIERLVTQSDRIIVQRVPVGALQLQSVIRRCLEGHALSLDNERLRSELTATLERLQRENEHYRGRIAEDSNLAGVIGSSPAMRRVYGLLERVAPLNTGVLLTGETGTGKTLIASAIHQRSRRSGAPFVAQNCAALPDTLLDSELFGHRRGAFTGASADRAGLFEAATGGTVFLDEIAEMSAAMQAKLLQVVQDGQIRRLGDVRTTQTDVRVLCATHRDLTKAVERGTFREDLYYRISTFEIPMPALRERPDDIPQLAQHFLGEFCERNELPRVVLSPEALKLLLRYRWPGNVRQLQATLERLAILVSPAREIDAKTVRRTLGLEEAAHPGTVRVDGDLDERVQSFERALIESVLDECGGVISEASRRLGVERSTLSRRCKRLGLVSGRGPRA